MNNKDNIETLREEKIKLYSEQIMLILSSQKNIKISPKFKENWWVYGKEEKPSYVFDKRSFRRAIQKCEQNHSQNNLDKKVKIKKIHFKRNSR